MYEELRQRMLRVADELDHQASRIERAGIGGYCYRHAAAIIRINLDDFPTAEGDAETTEADVAQIRMW